MKKLLIISDLHGNWPALEAVLTAEPGFGEVACCGDIVDYGPEPVKCVRWVREHAQHFVRGNHDNALGFDRDCQCLGTFREMSLATRAWHRTLMSDADMNFLRSMPTLDWFRLDKRDFRMAHATPYGGMFEYLAPRQWRSHILGIDADFVFLGHTHVQGMRTFGKVTVVNPGSVGLARDGAGEACYATYQTGKVTLHRVPYDVSRTIAELRRAPLPAAVIDGLISVLSPRESSSRPAEATTKT